ncbi:hypothetical protein OIU34_20750 [Pararhizobium sp. BT-229]|uniref:hypothetical protein n=1 Tax=Pararhizobium sp. BT-229 TaxID=2986923 RepID=UPI0021F734A2|nr:hypothetical protein [Pararhizobium sp. BT-229]MCV9964320.1 hypothetical protein [Pararhizobium sp. BT-229]
MKIAFQVPCVVRGRIGRGKGLKSVVTTTRVDFDVPEVAESAAVWSYAAELARSADGYSQFYRYDGQFYAGTGHYDNETVQKGWPEDPWQADTPLYARLWHALLDDLLEAGIGKGEDPNLSTVVAALTLDDVMERASAWDDLAAAGLKACPETEDDIEEARRKAGQVLDGLMIYRRELVLTTGQPCYAVHIKGREARITIGSTEEHQRLRAASFEHPVFYPFARSNDRIEALKHYFPIEEREAMLAFVEASGARVVGRVPKASRHRWADHDEVMDGLELDRIARITVHEIALAFASTTFYTAPSALLRENRSLFEAFYDLKEFLDERREPEAAGEELETRLTELREQAKAARSVSDGLINRPLGAFLDLALSRFGDRRISTLAFLPSAGALPKPL